VRGLARLLDRSGEAIGDHHVVSGCLTVGKRLEYHIVTALGERRPIPRAVERDEGTSPIGLGKLLPVMERESIGRPVRGK
jgi:hypothetical protein